MLLKVVNKSEFHVEELRIKGILHTKMKMYTKCELMNAHISQK